MVFRSPRLAAALALSAAALAGGVAGCGGSGRADSGKPVVAATAPQLDSLVRELAGGGIEVASVVAATADVHELELRPSQVRALRDATLILRPGRGNDAWAQEALDRVDGKQVDVSAGLAGAERHWWMDPALAEEAATAIAAELDRLDPAGETARAAALQRVNAELREIDAETKRCLATVPPSSRVIVTDHDAAGAYASRYGLTVAGTISPGADPEAAPSARRIVDLVATMEERGVKAVFPIAPHGSELATTVAQRGGAVLGEPLWADALPGATHGGEGHDAHADGEDEGHAADARSVGEHAAHVEGEPTLASAAHLNGEAVAEALGAKPSACGHLLG